MPPAIEAPTDTSRSRLFELSTIVMLLDCRPGDRVLDVGASPSCSAEFMRRFGYDVVSAGPDTALFGGPSAGACSEPCSCTPPQLPFDTGSFDGVLGMHVMHRVADRPKALAELCRVLKPGAHAVFCEPDAGGVLAPRPRSASMNGAHCESFDVLELMRAALDAGFTKAMLPASIDSPLTLIPLEEAELYRAGHHLPAWLAPTRIADELRGRQAYAVLVRDGTRPRTSRRPGVLRSRIAVHDLPATAVAGQNLTMRATVENTGDTVWLREPSRFGGFVTIGCQLLARSGRVVDAGLGRTRLTADVEPGDRIKVSLSVKVPKRLPPGVYTISVDLVNELVCHFSDLDPRSASKHPIEVLAKDR